MRFNVGQVIYVILNKNRSVVPMQVVEEITKKSMSADTVTTYMVRAGTDPKNSVLIEQIEGEIFESAAAVRKALIERATTSIDKILAQAVNHAQQWYPTATPPTAPALVVPQLTPHEIPGADDDDGAPVIQLPDGRMVRARVKLPEGLTTQ
jgi:hypothetical protein